MRSLAVVTLALVASAAADLRLHAQEPPRSAEADIATAPVQIDGTTLFHLRGVSSLPAQERARLVEERLTTVAADPAVPLESLHTVDSDGVTRILAGDRPILTVVDADASLEQVGRLALATAHLLRIRQAADDYRAARTPAAFRATALSILVATLILAAAVGVLLWFWRWLDRFLIRRLQARIQAVEIQSFEVMRAEQIWAALRNALLAVRTMILLALGLAFAGFVLAQIPPTRGLSRDMVAFALAPLRVIGQGILDHIPSITFLVVLYFFVRLTLRLTRVFFDAVRAGNVKLASFDPDWAEPTYKIVRIGIVAFALVVAYPYVPGSQTDAFKGVSLFIGVLFSLGSSSAIANIIAGYMMTYRRAFKVGDRVKIGEAMGDVIQTRLQVTHLRSLKNEEIVLPNSQILNSEVMNYSSLARTQGLILHLEAGIGYETPWRQVEAMLLMAAERTPGLQKDPPPFVLYKGLGDFAVTYELNVYCNNAQAMNPLYAALSRSILDVFNEYGVQIMTPNYEGDPEQAKIVSAKDWYLAPAKPSEDGSLRPPASDA